MQALMSRACAVAWPSKDRLGSEFNSLPENTAGKGSHLPFLSSTDRKHALASCRTGLVTSGLEKALLNWVHEEGRGRWAGGG